MIPKCSAELQDDRKASEPVGAQAGLLASNSGGCKSPKKTPASGVWGSVGLLGKLHTFYLRKESSVDMAQWMKTRVKKQKVDRFGHGKGPSAAFVSFRKTLFWDGYDFSPPGGHLGTLKATNYTSTPPTTGAFAAGGFFKSGNGFSAQRVVGSQERSNHPRRSFKGAR